MRVELRPTRPEDLPYVIGEPLPHRIKAITALADGVVLGVGGLVFKEGTAFAFVAMTDDARKYPMAIHRAGLMAMRMIRDTRLPRVIAQAQPDNPAAERWLVRLGFAPMETAAGRVFVWRRPT